ncbi:STK_08120 family protein [Acidianus sp. HS-5]|uniref:STK_08120 family protein n=1 Tax=Acidianus sp. HS-5 TaxID=2886040 RepID=UPI001F43129B|nr:STK_08120 family protein [Acidianus sp. HS-5]BDC17582.1 hypothetical protein HS5_04720 [Acidianus sp. HS-5]
MNNKVVISSSFEKDVMLKLFSNQKFFFTNFTPFIIVNEENENVFYIYGELYSIFSAFDVEARVRKYVSTESVTYILILQPGLISQTLDRLIDRSYKGVPPKGNGKIIINVTEEKIEISVDYEGDKEKVIVNSIIKK